MFDVPCLACDVFREVARLTHLKYVACSTWVKPYMKDREDEIKQLTSDLPAGTKLDESSVAIVSQKPIPRLEKVRFAVIVS